MPTLQELDLILQSSNPLWPNPKVKVTLRLTVSQSVSQSVSFGLTRWLLLFDSYGLVFVGHLLWREDGSVFCICSWPLPAQSFSRPTPLGLATVFYCFRFESSLFVASYNSQNHSGGIQPCLHTGWPNPSYRLSLPSLYRLHKDNTENTSYHCMCYPAASCLPKICLHGNLFIEPLPSNVVMGNHITISCPIHFLFRMI
jgi:hypothetical protein